jgi:hypothetical protein
MKRKNHVSKYPCVSLVRNVSADNVLLCAIDFRHLKNIPVQILGSPHELVVVIPERRVLAESARCSVKTAPHLVTILTSLWSWWVRIGGPDLTQSLPSTKFAIRSDRLHA